jgi:endo-alpha-1,4-polygalactosaminidase (GH114 family)
MVVKLIGRIACMRRTRNASWKKSRGKLLGKSRNKWKYNTKMKFWGIYFRCVKLTGVAYLVGHKMAVDFLHEIKVFVFHYLTDTGVSVERNVVCDSRIT